MARARNIKPGFYKNEDLAECTIWARYIFPGLWMLADREGRLEDRPKRIKGELVPFDTIDIEPLLNELAEREFILRYEANGSRYIQILNFERHQNPHHREGPSTIPKPEAYTSCNDQKALGLPESERPESDLERGSSPAFSVPSRADSGFSDSLIPDSGKKPKAPKRLVEVPDWLPLPQWDAYLEMRTKIRKPATSFAQKLAIAKLAELREQGHHPAAVLGQSIMNSWQGIFELKGQSRVA